MLCIVCSPVHVGTPLHVEAAYFSVCHCLNILLLTPFKEPSLAEVFEASLLRSDAHQPDTVGLQVWLQFADF